jgi:UDP-3-O-[3-hydroxymyristoyl] glucosamine N-acyltransferase
MKLPLQKIATTLKLTLIGDGSAAIAGVASTQSAGLEDLVFAQDQQHLDQALASRAAAILTGEFAAGMASKKPLLIAREPRLAFARAAAMLGSPGELPAEIHPSAVIHPTAKLGKDVGVAAFAVIGPKAVVGDRCRIGAGSQVGEGVVLGADCVIASNVTIESNTRIGDRVIVQSGSVLGSDGFGYVRDAKTGRHIKFPQIGTLEVGNDVEIGACCTIDRGALDATVIGAGTKIDNLVHVGHNVRIGANVVIAAQTGISGSVTVEDDVMIGGQVGIGDHAVIKRGVVLGGQAGVMPSKVLHAEAEPLWGTPAKPVRRYLRELAALGRLAKSNKPKTEKD